ncbi:MAG TPA: hypothetical protein VJ757_12215, partial [Pseudonocardiaceae bacterium]|nr:hypothetical protein [Pseudonocardiaceae bacterium]
HAPLVRQCSLVNHIDVSVDPFDSPHRSFASPFGLRATYAPGTTTRTAQRMTARRGLLNAA